MNPPRVVATTGRCSGAPPPPAAAPAALALRRGGKAQAAAGGARARSVMMMIDDRDAPRRARDFNARPAPTALSRAHATKTPP
jgi:hypothetical protein